MHRYLWFVFVVLTSCVNREQKVYEVPEELEPHVASFIVEAANRGKRLVIDDLIIDYRDNIFIKQKKAAGLCTRRYGHTPVIHIDSNSVNWKASAAAREQIIFHELCHCILGRSHTDDTLPNGNYKSIMRSGGETLYGPYLTAYKRAHYIDELFEPDISNPPWSQIIESYFTETNFKDTIYNEFFMDSIFVDTVLTANPLKVDSIQYGNWMLGENENTSRQVKNNHLEFKSISKGSYFIPFEVKLDTFDYFQIDVFFKFYEGNKGNACFYWGGSYIGDLYSIAISNNGYVSIGLSGQGTMFAKKGCLIFEDQINQLTIRKKNGNYFFFINQQLVDNQHFEALKGNLMGIGVSNGPTTVLWDGIVITAGKSRDSSEKK